MYTYDAIGSFERAKYSAAGSGAALVKPVLDSQVNHHNLTSPLPDLTKAEAVELVKDAMTSAGERDIYTGDTVQLLIIEASGITRETFELKKD